MAHGLSRCSTFKYGSAGTSAKTVIPLDGTVGRWWRRRRRRRSIDPPIIFQVRITQKPPVSLRRGFLLCCCVCLTVRSVSHCRVARTGTACELPDPSTTDATALGGFRFRFQIRFDRESRFPAVLPRGIRRVMSAECWIGIIRRFLGRSSGMVARTGIGWFGRRIVVMRSGSGPKEHKLVGCRRLHDEVDRGLRLKWSPEQISARLVVAHADDADADHGRPGIRCPELNLVPTRREPGGQHRVDVPPRAVRSRWVRPPSSTSTSSIGVVRNRRHPRVVCCRAAVVSVSTAAPRAAERATRAPGLVPLPSTRSPCTGRSAAAQPRRRNSLFVSPVTWSSRRAAMCGRDDASDPATLMGSNLVSTHHWRAVPA